MYPYADFTVYPYGYPQTPCPSCGHCPTCGQGARFYIQPTTITTDNTAELVKTLTTDNTAELVKTLTDWVLEQRARIQGG